MEEAVWINLDETPIPYHLGGKKGLRKHPRDKQESEAIKDRVSLAQIRGKCTLVASVASDSSFQEYLPQVLMPNTRGLKNKLKQAKDMSQHYNCIRIMNDTTRWMNNESMKEYFLKQNRDCWKW